MFGIEFFRQHYKGNQTSNSSDKTLHIGPQTEIVSNKKSWDKVNSLEKILNIFDLFDQTFNNNCKELYFKRILQSNLVFICSVKSRIKSCLY